MDYDILNNIIEQIISIVNSYNRERNYSVTLCEKLVMALLGYFLVFGPEIFKKIDVLLSALEIHEINSEEEYFTLLHKINENTVKKDFTPVMIYKYVYKDDSNIVKGAIPNILLPHYDEFQDISDLAHEMSHALEGVSATRISEDSKEFRYKQGFSDITMTKDTNLDIIKNNQFSEFITVCIEYRIAKALVSLDSSQINCEFVRRYLDKASGLKEKNFILNSYSLTEAVCKDLMDNDIFFDLIKKYYYDNETDLIEAEFNSYTPDVKLRTIMVLIGELRSEDILRSMQIADSLQKKIAIFSRATNFEPDRSILLLA